ncbi:hypothetical protein [Shewanella maritima]|uniref:hypothetical protein n=1 Tax=Shewanella maritima TaxID=2520507 RepID=UPI001F5EB291|nr:hypothetical protein [Shewanella maritima]
MSSKEISDLTEQKFEQLEKQQDAKVWNSWQDLLNLANDLKGEDIYLARRVLWRAKFLAPENEEQVLAAIKTTQREIKADEVGSEYDEGESNSGGKRRATSLLAKFAFLLGETEQQDKARQVVKQPWFIFVVAPFLLFAFYQIVWSSPRYESRAQLIVQQPDSMATMDASMALLTGLG